MSEIVKIGDATLYHGDCREILPTLDKHDLVLTDPPYGLSDKIKTSAGKDSSMFNGSLAVGGVDWDIKPELDTLGMTMAAGKDWVVWGGNYFCEGLTGHQCVYVWDKMNGTNPMADCEIALTSMEKGAKMFRMHHFSKGYEKKTHPTAKPLLLMEWCISHAPSGKTVLDPFMGSGTTGVACAQMGKAFTGIERERKYFDIACERIEKAYSQGQLFAAEPEPEPASMGLDLEGAA